ncbi:uncharacterized protein P884DRAFT_260372 [Thermothelomyces heterothallicus CBS 202.75]|uniref:uncharacterized protein n=1 Tax=Thermothelomyces heterothallicus CBS 202.75 TaxID=1149848 RepID=UPI0037435430
MFGYVASSAPGSQWASWPGLDWAGGFVVNAIGGSISPAFRVRNCTYLHMHYILRRAGDQVDYISMLTG